MRAEGTTLGADNGIGVAAAIAVSEDPELPHGPLELLFTVSEEQGLTGARLLDASLVAGRLLVNLDGTSDEGFTVGCAGSIHTSYGGTTTLRSQGAEDSRYASPGREAATRVRTSRAGGRTPIKALGRILDRGALGCSFPSGATRGRREPKRDSSRSRAVLRVGDDDLDDFREVAFAEFAALRSEFAGSRPRARSRRRAESADSLHGRRRLDARISSNSSPSFQPE